MCSELGNSYLNHRTYPDTSVELVKAHVGLKCFEHVQYFYYNF